MPMNYPGNEGQPGDWPTEQSPQSPYSPGQGPPGTPPYGPNPFNSPPAPDDELPFAPSRPGDSYGSSGGQRQSGPTSSGRRRRPLLIVGGAIVVGIVLVGGGTGIAGLLGEDSAPKSASSSVSQPTPTGSARPTVTNSPAPRPGGAMGQSRATDPKMLTLNEIFRHRTFKVGKRRYTMTVRRADADCAKAVNSAQLVAALRRGACNQVMRATFISGDGELIGTVGVANLRTAAAAKTATRLWNVKDAWVRPVPGAGMTKKIGTGSALGTFQHKGHYLLMTWVQQPDGKEIPSSRHKLISAFGQDVMLGSGLFEALHYRGNEGKPLQR